MIHRSAATRVLPPPSRKSEYARRWRERKRPPYPHAQKFWDLPEGKPLPLTEAQRKVFDFQLGDVMLHRLDLVARLPETGERRLMLAVLEDAIRVLKLTKLFGKEAKLIKLKEEAHEWFRSRDVTWPFAFETICEAFGWDADSLRLKLNVGDE